MVLDHPTLMATKYYKHIPHFAVVFPVLYNLYKLFNLDYSLLLGSLYLQPLLRSSSLHHLRSRYFTFLSRRCRIPILHSHLRPF